MNDDNRARLKEIEVKTVNERYWIDIDPDVGFLFDELRAAWDREDRDLELISELKEGSKKISVLLNDIIQKLKLKQASEVKK